MRFIRILSGLFANKENFRHASAANISTVSIKPISVEKKSLNHQSADCTKNSHHNSNINLTRKDNQYLEEKYPNVIEHKLIEKILKEAEITHKQFSPY